MADLFHYHPVTGEFLGQTEARPDPITEDPMVPGHATLIAPPAAKDGHVRVFKDGAWSQAEDHRDEIYWTADGVELHVTDLGPLPAGALTEAPVLPTYPTVEAANGAMLGWINALTTSLDAGMTDAEIRAKTKKAAAARAYLSDSATAEQTNMLTNEVALTGETVNELAVKIRDRADRDDAVDAQVAGLRRLIRDRLTAETDPYNYEAILENGKVQAKAMAKALGVSVS